MDKEQSAPRRLSRRDLLWMLGTGTAGGVVLGTNPWFRSALATTEPPPDSNLPTPSMPEPTFVPAGTPTVAGLAQMLEFDIEKMFRYVADEVAYEPYPGALRGPTGTMWGRAGNSVDKALLLAAVLTEAGVPVRFAIGTLGDAQTEALLASARMDALGAKQRAARTLLPTAVADAWTADGPWQRPVEISEMLDTARARVGSSVDEIVEALNGINVTLPAVTPSIPDLEMQKHVWLQYADGPHWIDLDPTISGATFGTTNAELVGEPSMLLPDDLFHTVTMRVVGDVVSGGVPSRTELLSHTVRSIDVVGAPIVLVHPTASWLGIDGAITGDHQYKPSLLVGEEVVEGAPITLSSGDGITGVFGEEGSSEGQTIAEWLEIDVNIPGDAVRSSVRNLFDRIPADQRESGNIDLAALPPIEFTHIDDDIGDVFLPFAGTFILSIAASSLPSSFFNVELDADDPVPALGPGAFGFHSLRDLCRLELLDDLGSRFYADGPGVVSLVMSPIGDTAGGAIRYGMKVDILNAEHGGLPLGDAESVANGGLIAGVVDHVVERMLIGALPFVTGDDSQPIESSVGRVFELAAEQGIPIVAVAPDQPFEVPDVPKSVLDLIENARERGRIIVLPKGPVTLDGQLRIGWWEVDPLTGSAIDRMDTGGSQAAIEYGFLLRVLAFLVCVAVGFYVTTVIYKMAAGLYATGVDAMEAGGGAAVAALGCVAGAVGAVGAG